MTLGEKIQKFRKEAGLSQEELSDQLGVSRQAISKWERDSGYPETEKIIRMSRIFNVTLDYLFKEEEAQSSEPSNGEPGLYVSREMAEGFISYQKRKMLKIGFSVGLFVGGVSLTFWMSVMSTLLFMSVLIVGVVILFSVKLTDDPYRKIWKEPLLFDKNVKTALNTVYAEKKKTTHLLNLIGIALIAIGFLFCPLIIPVELAITNHIALATGMIMAGIGIFLCVYMSGFNRAYRILIRNEAYHEKRK